MNEWITEIRAIEGTEVWDTFTEYKKACLRRGDYTRNADLYASNNYYLRFLDWAPLTTKDTIDQNSPKDLKIEEYPPATLEECLERYLAQGWNRQYQHRFRNINTGEIIPAEVLCD